MTTRRASYLFMFVLLAAACFLRFGSVLLAGLYAYMILDLTHRSLSMVMPQPLARWLAVFIFIVTACALTWMFAAFLKMAVIRMPAILGSALPIIDGLAARYGLNLPFENLHELRVLIVQAIKENARSITATSGLLTRGAFQIFIGVLAAMACFLSPPTRDERASLFTSLRDELEDRVHLFMISYEKVLGAQVIISLINTIVTAAFIVAVGIPYLRFLSLACFILGVIPVVGNVASNAVIVGAALTLSPEHALLTLIFLTVSHRVQYFINGRVIGARLDAPMWMTLLGILVGEAVLGVPGMILAPAIIHYAREELTSLPAPAARR